MKFLEKLENRSKLFIYSIAAAQIFILGIIDYVTGFELSFSVFYLIPVALTAWYAERNIALIVSIASALTWEFSNHLAGETFQNALIPIWNTLTRLGFFLITTILLTKLKDSYQYQKSLAGTDFLTGAANPRLFYESVKMEMLRSRRYQRPFTICYLDADNFKLINDTFGHQVGSDLLVQVAETIKKTLRSTDIVARLGGDEFAIVLSETNSEQARIAIGKFHKNLLNEMDRNDWAVTFSIGVLTYYVPPETVEEVIKIADGAMYEVKKNGKNSVIYKDFGKAVKSESIPVFV